jgi:FkbM family methyltransferase
MVFCDIGKPGKTYQPPRRPPHETVHDRRASTGAKMKKKLLRFARQTVERFPRAAMTYRYLREIWQIYEVPMETPMGFKLAGNHSMKTGRFEPEETRIVRRILPYVDIVVNVGANIGYYCCIALSQDKYVVAIEPVNLNLRHLLKNVKANHWESRIEVHQTALSDGVGLIELYGGGNVASLVKGWAGTPEQDVTLVPCTTLDNVLGARFQSKTCFILVDIEGAEQLMLEGASSIIAMQPKPIWMVEISISKHQPRGVTINPNLSSTFNVFWNHGYEAWTADKHCRIIQPDEIARIFRSGVDTLRTNNFLFVEKGKKHEFLDT